MKEQTLDPKKFEVIKVESSPYRVTDSLANNAYLYSKELLREYQMKMELEKFRQNLETYNVTRLYPYAKYEDRVESLLKSNKDYKEYKKIDYIPSYWGYETHDEYMLGQINIFEYLNVGSYSPSLEQIDSIVNIEIPKILADSLNTKVLHYEVLVRYYGMNRLGTRGISDAALIVYPEEDGTMKIELVDATSF